MPRPVHRLDALTTGILVIAKTIKTRIDLGRLFEERSIQKEYHAIVQGKTEEAAQYVARAYIIFARLGAAETEQAGGHLVSILGSVDKANAYLQALAESDEKA